MVLIGVTSGICCGKTLVTKFFEERGAVRIDCDQIVANLYKEDKELINEITEQFGTEILNEDKTIDKKKLGQIVWHNEQKRLELDEIVHPKVFEKINYYVYDKEDIVVVEIPLLVESGMNEWFDKIIVVEISDEEQLKRTMKKYNLTEEEAKERINTQLPIQEKLKYAHYTIDNNKTEEETKKQVEKIYEELVKLK